MTPPPEDEIDVRAELASARALEEPVLQFLRDCLARARAEGLEGFPAAPIGLDVLLTGDPGIRRLNKRWRGNDKATDVLSFPAAQGAPPLPGIPSGFGDLTLSITTARRQARARGHDLATELRTLLVHGLLHLAGYDHGDDAEELRMERAAQALGYPSHPHLLR